MKLVSVSIAILLSFALINCGGDDKGGTTPQENTSQAAELSIVITSPTGTGSFTTIDSSVTVEGQAMGPVEKVEWSVAGGDSGTADGTVNWTIKNLSLELGENLLTVKATGGGQEDSAQLLIVRNENVNYLSTPFLKPDTVFVNAAEEVVVTVEIDQNDKYDPATVKLIKVKSDNTTEELKAMTDDGDVINGDDIAGDGVYSAALFFTEAAAGDIMIKVSAQPKGGGDPEFSPPAFLHVIEQLTNDQNQEMLNVLDKAQKLYEEKVVELGHDKAKEEVLKLLEGDPVVDEAGSSEEGRGLWAIFKYGVIGVWEFNEEGEKGGGMKYGNAAPRYDFRASSKNPVVRNAAPSQFLDSVQFSATEDVNKINNTGAIVIGAFLAQFGADDDAPAVLEILKKSECPKFQIDGPYYDASVTVDTFESLYRFGVVVISSHGDTYLGTVKNAGKWGVLGIGSNDKKAKEYIRFGGVPDAVTLALPKIQKYLKTGRLVLAPKGFGVTPHFISALPLFPNSLVYVSICRGFRTGSLAKAFIGRGAKSYFGYSDYVNAAWAMAKGTGLFKCLVEDGKNTRECYTHDKETDADPAEWLLSQPKPLTVAVSDFRNGSFEEGKKVGWLYYGDARALHNLGGYNPTDGSLLGLISTGLGRTTTSGGFSQSFCIPAGYKTISFDYNFISAEFMSWCNSQYMDSFVAQIESSLGNKVLEQKIIDDLCGSVGASLFTIPQDGDPDGTYAAGWQSVEVDISEYSGKGKSVTLKLSADDVGDSIYDTAVLLDNITLNK